MTKNIYRYIVDFAVDHAEVVKLVDTYVSGAYVERHGGSSPLLSIFSKLFDFGCKNNIR